MRSILIIAAIVFSFLFASVTNSAQAAKKPKQTLVVYVPGWSQGQGRKREEWIDPMRKQVSQTLSGYGSDNHSMVVEWPSFFNNKEATEYVSDQIRDHVNSKGGRKSTF